MNTVNNSIDIGKLPFVFHCQNLKKIYKHGTPLYVPCGKCPTCLLHKNNHNASLATLEGEGKYCLFVTLTYDNENIPRLTLVPTRSFTIHGDSVVDYDIFDTTERSVDCGFKINRVSYRPSTLHSYVTKFRYFPTDGKSFTFPCLSKRDLQLFLKRLRIKLKRTYDRTSNIRFIACGEYGPKHFRPHFHILFFFRSFQELEECRECLPQVWKYGNIDCSIAEKAISYVARYVNSPSDTPRFLTLSSPQFCVHSTHMGEQLYKTSHADFYEVPFSEAIRRDIVQDGDVISIQLPREVVHYYFPKQIGFTYFSRSELHTLYEMCSRYYRQGFKRLEDIATSILSPTTNLDHSYYDLIRSYVVHYSEVDKLDYRYLHDLVYRILLVSNKFHNICVTNSLSSDYVFSKIYDFYKNLDLFNLNERLKYNEFNPSFDPLLCFDNWYSLDEFENSIHFCDILQHKYSDDSLKSYSYVKHKVLKEANYVFLHSVESEYINPNF